MEYIAIPLLRPPLSRAVVSSKNVTVPVGTAAPDVAPPVAVSVIDCPVMRDVAELVRVVVVAGKLAAVAFAQSWTPVDIYDGLRPRRISNLRRDNVLGYEITARTPPGLLSSSPCEYSVLQGEQPFRGVSRLTTEHLLGMGADALHAILPVVGL